MERNPASEIEEFFNVTKLYEYEESVHHKIEEKQVRTDPTREYVWSELMSKGACAKARERAS